MRLSVLLWCVFYTAIISEDCINRIAVGSLSHDGSIVTAHQTYILAEYVIPCNGIVVAWEFCYQRSNATSVTFYPGIWRVTEEIYITGYELVQSNAVTYNPTGSGSNNYQCQAFHLPETNQFTAPAGSVIGLYSGIGTQLLRTDHTNILLTTYNGNQSRVNIGHNDYYNVAIKVHLGKQ